MDTGESGAINSILASTRISGITPGSDRQYGQKQKQFKRNGQAGVLPVEEETVDIVDLSEEYAPHSVASVPESPQRLLLGVAKQAATLRKRDPSHIDIEV